MCLVLTWNWLFLETKMANLLSQYTITGQVSGCVISTMKVLNHRASFMVCMVMRYSASVLESVIMGCFLELQETVPQSIIKT